MISEVNIQNFFTLEQLLIIGEEMPTWANLNFNLNLNLEEIALY